MGVSGSGIPKRDQRRTMKARITVTLKKGISDPQGKAVGESLAGLGFTDLGRVRQGRFIEIDLPAAMREQDALETVERMCAGLLVNPVMEEYSVEIAGS